MGKSSIASCQSGEGSLGARLVAPGLSNHQTSGTGMTRLLMHPDRFQFSSLFGRLIEEILHTCPTTHRGGLTED